MTPNRSADHATRFWQNAILTDEHGNKFLIRPLTGDARSILERRRREIDRLLMPLTLAERAQAAAEISKMLGGFMNARSSDPKGTLAHFTAVLQEFPLWSIKEACRKVSRGDLADQSPDFPPSAPRMFQAVAECLLELRGERFKITQILETKTKEDKTPDENERERVMSGFRNLSSGLSRPNKMEDLARERQKAAATRRAITATNREIEAEWRAAGLEPVYANGQPVSMALARMTGALQRQIDKGFSPSTAADLQEEPSKDG